MFQEACVRVADSGNLKNEKEGACSSLRRSADIQSSGGCSLVAINMGMHVVAESRSLSGMQVATAVIQIYMFILMNYSILSTSTASMDAGGGYNSAVLALDMMPELGFKAESQLSRSPVESSRILPNTCFGN